MHIKNYIGLMCLMIFHFGNAQVQTDTLAEVEVNSVRLKTRSIQQLNRLQIQQLNAEDAGELLQKFSGVTLKNYGGLGGMKTISVRGIGGTHTAIVVDGFIVQNTQTGQVDLGTMQAENIEKIAVSVGGSDGSLLPVSAYLGGSTLEIQTMENRFGGAKLQMRSSFKQGSFGQYDGFHSMKWNRKKMYVSVLGKYRQAVGDYPYELKNGQEIYSGKRLNTDLKEGFAGIGLGVKLSKSSLLKFNYQANLSQKGLPGAVIFYNPVAVQRLDNQSHQLNLDHRYLGAKWSLRNYASARYEAMTYSDYGYLNAQGFLKQDFYNASLQHGIVTQALLKNDTITHFLHEISGGIEQNFSTLNSTIANFARPQRYHLKAFFSDEMNWKNYRLIVQVAGQAVFDQVQVGNPQKNRYVLNPYVFGATKRDFTIVGNVFVWAKRSLRMPTFNELYYKEIGNQSLKPEIALQFNGGFKKEITQKIWSFGYGIEGYYNHVENKIVAIPTKNLFIWSMQNVGKVEIIGADLHWNTSYKRADFQAELRMNYTFQLVRDKGDRAAPTYLNQLAYFPVHTGNVDLNVYYKKIGMSFSNFIIGDRFALNENTESNRVAGFWSANASVFYKIKLAHQQNLRISLAMKNIGNQSYAFVKYYVMPGINYLIALNYEFN